MKNIIKIFIVALGITLFFSTCQKNDFEPKLNLAASVGAELTTPENGDSFHLALADSANPFTVDWTATTYTTSDNATLPLPTYSLRMVLADSSFDGAMELYNTQDLFYETIVYKFNQTLIDLGITADSTGDVELRVESGVSGVDYTVEYSEVIKLSVTTFEPPAGPEPDPTFIYLIGDATPAGWDNALALPMSEIKPGVFARVETLDPAGEWFKFLSNLGAWAPQWGTDETGTTEIGPLVYRPTEDDDDPPAIPSPEVLGSYYIEADTVNLTYWTQLTSGELYLVGAATPVGWDAATAMPFTEVESHVFEITVDLVDGGMKFLEIQGEWAPQWGTNEFGTSESGLLVYRPDEVTADPAEVPSPGTGTFKIRVDLATISYTIEPQ